MTSTYCLLLLPLTLLFFSGPATTFIEASSIISIGIFLKFFLAVSSAASLVILLVPIVFAIAMEAGVSILYLGIPMAAALSVTHGFLPPHPAPTAISAVLGASAGHVLLYGIIVAIPAVIVAGPLYTKIAKK
mgnify:CR=1 FL=1